MNNGPPPPLSPVRSAPAPESPRQEHARPGLERFLTAVLLLVPVLHHFGTIVPQFNSVATGYAPDVVVNYWVLWHNSLWPGSTPLYSTDHLMAPLGTTLLFNTMCVVPTLLVAPIARGIGVYAAYNTLLVFHVLLAGVGMYLLVRRLTGSRLCAAFGAFLLEMSPILYHRLIAHFSLAMLGAVPLILFYFDRFSGVREVRRRAIGAVGAGAFLFLVFLTDYNIFLYCSFLLGGYVVATGLRRFQGWLPSPGAEAAHPTPGRLEEATAGKQFLGFVAVSAGVFGVLVAGFFLLAPFAECRAWGDASFAKPGVEVRADLAYFLIPNPEHWAFSDVLPQLWVDLAPLNPERTNYLGLVPLALAVVGLRYLYKRNRVHFAVLTVCGGLAFFLSLGSALNFLGMERDLPKWLEAALPFQYWEKIPVLAQSRVPARWAMVLNICVLIAAGCGLRPLLQKATHDRTRLLLLGAAATLVMLEYSHLPTRTLRFTPPEAYRNLGRAQSPDDMILEVPVWFVAGNDRVVLEAPKYKRMAWAVDHGYRIVSCYLSRISRRRIEFLLNEPLLKDLWMLQGGTEFLHTRDHTPPGEIRRWLHTHRVRYILVETFPHRERVLDYLDALPGIERCFQDKEYVAYRVGAEEPL